ncbi:MAG: DedA family protein [Bacillota bacterium]|nr:DedA family protein [Bacillota bacterium]MDP4158452.1 DedA family protein [Bacillota bacterium]
MEGIITSLGQFVVHIISTFGYAGVFFAMAIESACIPLPSEIILPFTGYMVYAGNFGFWQATIAATLGNLFGGLIAYYVGVWGGRPFLKKYGRYFFIKEHELAWTERLFERHGEVTVFVGRILPIVRTFISLPAGIARMNPLKMATYTVTGAFLWCSFLIFVGQKLGENWDSLKSYFHRADAVVGGIIVFVLIFALWKHRRR